jgi:hypothetical protein
MLMRVDLSLLHDVLLSFLNEKYDQYSKSCAVNAGKLIVCSHLSSQLGSGSGSGKGKGGGQRGGAHQVGVTHAGCGDGCDGNGTGVFIANNGNGHGGSTVASLVETAPSAEIVRIRRPPASRGRLSSEQALIEDKNTVWAKPPFIEDSREPETKQVCGGASIQYSAGVNSEEPQHEGGHSQVASEADGQGPCR